jgi:hypothetical protein
VYRSAVFGICVGATLTANSASTVHAAEAAGAAAQSAARNPQVWAAADALGMVRGFGPAQNATSLIVTTYEGTGTLDGSQVQYRFEYVYAPYPAARLARKSADGKTAIQVVREGRAWNEAAPGVDPAPVNSGVARRMASVYLTPHGAVRAAVTAGQRVKVAEASGTTTITVPVERVGIVSLTLDANRRPSRVQVDFAGGTVAARYSDYADFNNYGVFAPRTITLEEGKKVVGELTVEKFAENPYVIVPFPEQLKAAAQ